MADDFYLYLWALYGKYQLVAGVVVPSFIIGWGLSLLERFKQFAGYRAESVISAGRWIIALLVVFFIGFLTWRDEYNARSDAEKNYKDLLARNSSTSSGAARLEVGDIEPVFGDFGRRYKVKYNNNGSIPAQMQKVYAYLVLSDQGPYMDESGRIMNEMEKDALKEIFEVSPEIEITPNHWLGYDLPIMSKILSKEEEEKSYQEIIEGRKYLYIYTIVIYIDDSLSAPIQRRVMKYCASYTKIFSQRFSCPGQNKTFVYRKSD